MPRHEIHCKSCKELYGEEFREVHKWMDEPAEDLGPAHQKHRHDMEKTPERARAIFGKDADLAARDHILLDKRWGEIPKLKKRNVRFPQLTYWSKNI